MKGKHGQRNRIVLLLNAYLPPVFYAYLIFLLSSRSYDSVSLGYDLDKIVHLGVYAGLGYWILRAFRKAAPIPGGNLWAILIVLSYGISDEIHQFYVPGREFEIMDMVFDGLGGVVAVLFGNMADRLKWSVWL